MSSFLVLQNLLKLCSLLRSEFLISLTLKFYLSQEFLASLLCFGLCVDEPLFGLRFVVKSLLLEGFFYSYSNSVFLSLS